MRTIISLTLISLLSTSAFAETKSMDRSYVVTKREIDKKILKGNTRIDFTIYNPKGELETKQIGIQLNGDLRDYTPRQGGVVKLKGKEGSTDIYLYGLDYKEIHIAKFDLASQEHIYFDIHFQHDKDVHPVRKPVMYLYPTETINVSVQLDVKGQLDFTYPAYDKEWKVTACPGGDLIVNNNKFRYLFWEAHSAIDISKASVNQFVKADTLLAYLEHSLDQMNFNAQEKQDFITYWYPLMQGHDHLQIRFMFNQACDHIAQLHFSTNPKHLFRVYMVWNEIDANEIPDDVSTAEFPAIQRDGFHVVEWGGTEWQNTETVYVESE